MSKIFFIILLLLFFQIPTNAEIKDFMVETIDESKVVEPYVNVNYDYSDTLRIPIQLQITKKISTRDKDLYEGNIVEFRVVDNVYVKDKMLLKKGDIVTAKVKLIEPSGMNGIQFIITLGDFYSEKLNRDKLTFEYEKHGWNRTYIVLPIKWALTILPPTGSLTNLIKGGHSKITPRTKVFIYYYPNMI